MLKGFFTPQRPPRIGGSRFVGGTPEWWGQGRRPAGADSCPTAGAGASAVNGCGRCLADSAALPVKCGVRGSEDASAARSDTRSSTNSVRDGPNRPAAAVAA